MIGEFLRGPKYNLLMRLESAGFLRVGTSRQIRFVEAPWLLTFHKQGILTAGRQGHTIEILGAVLTTAGREFLKIVAPGEDPAFIQELAVHIKSLGPESVIVGTISPDGKKLINTREV